MADVLLVDDDGSVLITLAIALRRHGHSVTVACDGQQALSQLDRRHFNFLVSDVRMPDMNGIELARQVRHRDDAPCVILTSAHYSPPEPNDNPELFLPKPIDPEQLHALFNDAAWESQCRVANSDATWH